MRRCRAATNCGEGLVMIILRIAGFIVRDRVENARLFANIEEVVCLDLVH